MTSRTNTSSPSSHSSASSDSMSLPGGPLPRLTPPGSPQDTFGGHTTSDLTSPLLSPSPLSPRSARPISLATTGTGSGSRTSPYRGPESPHQTGSGLGGAAAAGSRVSSSTFATSSGPSSAGPSLHAGNLPTSSSFGPATGPSLAPPLSVGGDPNRPVSLLSVAESFEYSSYSAYSQRSSWLNPSPSASSAAIGVARKLRLSANPPLPEHPYLPESSDPEQPTTNPGSSSSPSTGGAATASATTGGPDATRSTAPLPPSAFSGVGGIFPSSSSSSSLRPRSGGYSIGGPHSPTSSLFSRRSRASLGARAIARASSPDEPLPSPLGAMSFASTNFPSMSPRATPTEMVPDLPALPGELPLPHYSFLDEDPTLGLGFDSPLRGGVSQFSGGRNRASAQSAPAEPAARAKHFSTQSGFSDISTGGNGAGSQASAPAGPSRNGGIMSRWSSFAGGPPPAWGRRDSVRSVKSTKSTRSNRSLKKRSSKHASMISSKGHAHEEIVHDGDWEKDDESVDLSVLVRRAAILERLLRTGKRASGIASKRMSSMSASTSTHYSGLTSKQSVHGRSNGNSRSNEKSTSNSQRRSAQSVGSSIRQHLAHRLGLGPKHPFTGLGSEDGDTTTTESSNGGFVDIISNEDTSTSSHYPPPGTPPRRAMSTSISRPDFEIVPIPGQGSGVIVFPELATMPPPVPVQRDGEVCAQSCLPASIAVPYTPLPPPPPTAKVHTSRSLHSLRNLRFVDEKQGLHIGSWSNASVPFRTSHNSSMLIGDVPSCDDHSASAAQRRLKILLILASVIVVGVIVGLLAGLLTRRVRYDHLQS